jgi:hypothetical protein
MKNEVFFRDVKLGELFEFHSQLFACQAVKAEEARVILSNGRARSSNLVIVKILSSTKNVTDRKPGDYEWCPPDGIVIVDRTLPSGS